MNLKSISICISILGVTVYASPDVPQMLEESKTAISYAGTFTSSVNRKGSDFSIQQTHLQGEVSYKTFMSQSFSFDISPSIGYGSVGDEEQFMSANLGIGFTKYFLSENSGPTIGLSVGSRNYFFGEYFDSSSIFLTLNPGYMVQLKDEFYLNTGIVAYSDFDIRGKQKNYFDQIMFSYQLGVTEYF